MRLEAASAWWRARDPWEKVAITAWSLLVLVVSVRALGGQRSHSVYPIFATAARHWSLGEDLYVPPAPGTAHLDVYRYSPLVAAGLTPLSILPDPLGSVLWRLLNVSVCLAGLGWFCLGVLPSSLTRGQQAAVFLLVLPLCVGNLNNAQSNPLVLGLVLAAVAAAAGERWNLSAGCLALACLFKLYPIAVGLLLVVVYPRRLAGRLAAALAIGLAVPFLLQSPEYVAAQYAAWADCLHGDDRGGLPLQTCYRDLPLLCRLWGRPLTPGLYQAVQIVAGGAMAVICWAGRTGAWPRRRLLTLLLGLGSCWMTVLGPATESCTYLLLAPAVAWALVEAWRLGQPGWCRAWLVMIYGLLVATYMSCWFPGSYRLQAFGLQPLAGLLLLVHLLTGPLREIDRPSRGRVGIAYPSDRSGSASPDLLPIPQDII